VEDITANSGPNKRIFGLDSVDVGAEPVLRMTRWVPLELVEIFVQKGVDCAKPGFGKFSSRAKNQCADTDELCVVRAQLVFESTAHAGNGVRANFRVANSERG
jgi:hypothetical protein